MRKISDCVAAPLWAHQRRAVDFITKAWASGYPGVLAAMRMGTGKTRTALVAAFPAGTERVLVLCPKSVAPVWGKELAALGLAAAVLELADGAVKERAQRLVDGLALSGGHLVVVNYEACFREPLASALRGQYWDAIITDECHRVKRPGGVTSRFVGRLGETTRRRLGLSGTPFTQSHLDAYGQYRFLDPYIFSTVLNSGDVACNHEYSEM